MKKETAIFLDRVCIEMFGAIAVLIYIAIFGMTRYLLILSLYSFISLVVGYLLGKHTMVAQLSKKEKVETKSRRKK